MCEHTILGPHIPLVAVCQVIEVARVGAMAAVVVVTVAAGVAVVEDTAAALADINHQL